MSGDPSRPFKWVTVVCSVVTVGFLVAAAVRENVSADWRGHQAVFRGILLTKAKDDAARATARNLPIEIRQVVVPALHTVDRCVTCHLGIDDPGWRTSPIRIARTPSGCSPSTGWKSSVARSATRVRARRSTSTRPRRKTTSGTTRCCLRSSRRPRARRAMIPARCPRARSRSSCSACDCSSRKAATAATNSTARAAAGPALDNEGLKTKHQFVRASLKGSQTNWNWFAEHFRDPAGIVAGSLMPMPALSQPQVEALTVYMLSLRQRDLPAEYLAPDKIDEQYARAASAALRTAPRSTSAIARPATIRACTAVGTRNSRASFRASETRPLSARKTMSAWRKISAKAVQEPACRAGVPRQGV